MNTRSPSITVLARADSPQRLQDIISASHLSFGANIPVVVVSAAAIIDDIRRTGQEWPAVHLVPHTLDMVDLLQHITSDHVLVLPPSSPILFAGVSDAEGLMDSRPDVKELGGLIIGSGGAVVSGAFNEIHRPHNDSVALAPLEELDPRWTRQGSFAFTPTHYLGGLTMVRREHLHNGHLHSGSLPARALLDPNSDNAPQRLLYSGLIAFTRWGIDTTFNESGHTELLPLSSYPAWVEADMKQATLLHRGVFLRHDELGEVVHLADNRIAAVDGNGHLPPHDPSHYYQLTSSRIQLGPGFLAVSQWMARRNPGNNTDSGFRGSLEGPTDLERTILSWTRKIAAHLPGPVIRYLKRILRK